MAKYNPEDEKRIKDCPNLAMKKAIEVALDKLQNYKRIPETIDKVKQDRADLLEELKRLVSDIRYKSCFDSHLGLVVLFHDLALAQSDSLINRIEGKEDASNNIFLR